MAGVLLIWTSLASEVLCANNHIVVHIMDIIVVYRDNIIERIW
jgi:hypothetical protein